MPIKLGWMSILGNLLFFGLKYWAGVSSGSIAIVADAWHTLSDSLSSVVVLVGVKIASMPADREHPFGHGRAEQIASIIIGLMLIVVAVEFVTEAIEKFNAQEQTNYTPIAIIVTVLSVVAKEVMAQVTLWGARKTESSVLRADAWHHRSDAISSVIILVGIFVGCNLWWIDSALGLLVAVMIGWAAYSILKENILPLIGEKIGPELEESIKKHAADIAVGDAKIHHLHIHKYGRHAEVTFHMMFPPDITLFDAHSIATKLEVRLRERIGIESTIHIEPYKNSKIK